MAPTTWPLRLVPKGAPRWWQSLLITAAAMLIALAVRDLALGRHGGFGIATTYPALMLIALYAGPRWGWLALGAELALMLVSPPPIRDGLVRNLAILLAISGSFTVLVATALREALMRLAEANQRQASIQAALDRSEARLQLAQEAGGVGLWDWDLVAGEGYWSPTTYRNLGVPRSAEPTFERLLETTHPDDRARVTEIIRRGREDGVFEPFTYRVVWPDGSVRWVLSRGELIMDQAGRPIRAVGVNMDVTDRQAAYEQVRQSEARFRALADSAPVLMWVTRKGGQREFANKAYVEFLGESYDAALSFDWRKRLHPDDLDRILAEQVAGEASRQQFTLEARYRRADGEYRWIRSVSQPRYAPSGEFEGFIGIGFDVTDAKQAEADLKRINELLADRVQAALAERDQAEAALRRAQKLEAVGQLTGGVAHDFNNLLTVIIGALDLIQRHPADAARRDRMLEAALGAARRGERLTNQLLSFARRQALKPQLMCIDDLLAESEPLLRRAVGEAVSLTVEPNAPGAVALIDPSQFEAALMNLAVNARDAVTGGGAIRIETHPCSLDRGQVEEVDAGDYVCVVVHDTGVGMAPEVLGRVFEPFFTTKEVGKGTGLGLSQVYGFARQSGGGVAIESAVGKGSSVRLYLPRSSQAAAGGEEVTLDKDRSEGPHLRVLLVEDDLEVGDLVTAMLEELGHQVIRASEVEAGLQVLREGAAVDLLLTDLVMPGGRSGVDLAQEATRMRPGLPVILSSGYTGEVLGPAERAPWPLLRKPYSAEALARMIDQALERPAQPA
ncbi:hybrid sensor histidine kinase/response regulator [Phenylobacterium sp.]|uniref:hybrid sensor histidine kinase/response regulator n=1 Tax=Phenylobacterium sp. TaxID=1871053 RepID=UPI002E2EB26E|nr:PAS domain-containing protein [Phenylobacterium sp.]HEX2561028.1 PAS domain-containing protein [Phenylobacterium sp.]